MSKYTQELLPPLPETNWMLWRSGDTYDRDVLNPERAYTDEQMHNYARLALASRREIPLTNLPKRMWINQPFELQPLNSLHGQNVLAIHDFGSLMKIYFLHGSIESQQIPLNCLSMGWIVDE